MKIVPGKQLIDYSVANTFTFEDVDFNLTQTGNEVGLSVTKTGAGAGNAFAVENDGTGVGVYVNQDGIGYGIDVDQAAAESAVRITQAANDIGLEVIKSGTGTGFGISVVNAGTAPALYVAQTGSDVAVRIIPDDVNQTHLALFSTANAASLNFKVKTIAHTTDSGTGTSTITDFIPAGAIVMSVTARVTTILAGAGLGTWSIGITGTTDLWGTTLAIAAGTTVNSTNHLTTWQPTLYPAATSVILTASAGVFSTGVVRVTIFYIDSTAPTS